MATHSMQMRNNVQCKLKLDYCGYSRYVEAATGNICAHQDWHSIFTIDLAVFAIATSWSSVKSKLL